MAPRRFHAVVVVLSTLAAAILLQCRRRRITKHCISALPHRLPKEERAPKKSRTPKDATPQHGDPRFFAAKDSSGLLSINPRLIDTFLRWECGRTLLGMNLFPNMQEISESMACLAAVTEQLADGQPLLADSDVVAIVIGDGRTPRTAALLAMRTRWTVVSIDPALHGLLDTTATASTPSPACAACEPDASVPDYRTLPKELRHPRLEAQEQHARARARRAVLRADLIQIERLSLIASTVEQACVRLTLPEPPCDLGLAWPDLADPIAATAPARYDDKGAMPTPQQTALPTPQQTPQQTALPTPLPVASFRLNEVVVPVVPRSRLVVLLPHAHVTPDAALGCIRYTRAAAAAQQASGCAPAITVVQLPCCNFVWHDLCCGLSPEVDFLDARICAVARAVRVWRDVGPAFDVEASVRGHGVPKGGSERQKHSALSEDKRKARRAAAEERERRREQRRQNHEIADSTRIAA